MHDREKSWQDSQLKTTIRFAHALEKTPNEAAIHRDGGSVYVAGALGRQECNHCGKLLRRSDTACGNLMSPAGEDLFWFDVGSRGNTFRKIIEACRTCIPWANVVYGDAISRIFIGQRACQAGHRGSHRVREQQPIHRLLYRG